MSGSAIRAGVLLPPRDDLLALSEEVAALLSAYLDEQRGGPAVDLLFVAPQGTPAERAHVVREFAQNEQPLALVASFTAGADAELAAVADELEIPLLATLSPTPRSSVAPSRWLRDLCGGVIEQSAALLRHVGMKRVALVHSDEAIARRIAGAQPFVAAETSARDLQEFDAVLLAGLGEALARLVDEMGALDRSPALLLAGAALPPAIFERVRPARGVWVAMPMGAPDQTPSALAAYADLVRRRRIPIAHRFSQFATLTSLQLFLDAVRRCGNDLTRPSLLAAVDATRGFYSGLLPPLTYGGGRHIGSTGAWVHPLHQGRAVSPVWVDQLEVSDSSALIR